MLTKNDLISSIGIITIICLLVQTECATPYQCSPSFTFLKSNYDTFSDSGAANQLQEFLTVQTSLQKIDGKIRQLQSMIYLVKTNQNAPKNILRVKVFQTDGSMFQLPDYTFSDQVKFIQIKSAYGVAVTKDSKLYNLKTLYTGITAAVFNLTNQVWRSSVITDYSDWTLLSLVHSDGFQNSLLMRNADRTEYSFLYFSSSSLYVQHSFVLPNGADIQPVVNFIIYEKNSKSLYRLGTQRQLVTCYGNQQFFSMYSLYHTQQSLHDIALYYQYTFLALLNYNQDTKQAHFHLLYANENDVTYLRAITTQVFTNYQNIQRYYSSYNQHVIEYDGQNLRFSSVMHTARQFYGYTTTQGDDIQLLIKNSTALQFDFLGYKFMIMTSDAKIHEISLYSGFNQGQTGNSNPLIYYYVRQNLILGTHFGILRTIDLGTEVTDWIESGDSQYILTKTQCVCIQIKTPIIKCFTNNVCLFVENKYIFDCSVIENNYI